MDNFAKSVLTCTKLFSNGVAVVNTTPHPITFLDGTNIVTVPADPALLVNAKSVEKQVDEFLVTTVFVPTPEGTQLVENISKVCASLKAKRCFIIGSIIAAQAYPGRVLAMTPAPGYERVPIAEKRMAINKFTVFK